MTTLRDSILIAFSTFSAIPMPHVNWDARSMRYSLVAFPMVGVVIALCGWGWAFLCAKLGLPDVLRGAGLCLLPIWITGGIHLDGYADVSDALASHADPETRQRILKDPHVGAFAVIRIGSYLIADFALWTALPQVALPAMLGIFGLSRSLSGIALTSFRIRPGSGLARTFAENAEKKPVRIMLIVLALLFGGMLFAGGGVCSTIAALLVFWRYSVRCRKDFGGLSGDLAGWFVQTAEIWMLAMLVLYQRFGGLG